VQASVTRATRDAKSGDRQAASDSVAPDADDDSVSDDTEDADEPDDAPPNPESSHPFDGLSSVDLSQRLKQDPASLGSASLGRPNAGALFNGVQLPENPAWKREDPSHAWGTSETVEALTRALLAVASQFPNTPAVSIGHLSAQRGGPLSPHVSHQSGRDVDVGLYYRDGTNRWYARGTGENLDLERTYWLLRYLANETTVEMILLDQSLINWLERYAQAMSEPEAVVTRLFRRHGGRPALVRHARGHATHLHIRFLNPTAQASGRRLTPLLVQQGIVTEPPRLITHVAKTGDTLAKLAARYSTSMQAIQKANGMKTFQLVAGNAYRIPAPVASDTAKRATPHATSHKH
jgi:penicillin-insensitive murein endopeptidase